MSLSGLEIVAAIAIVTVGATVQSAVGFGLGLVSAPILLLIDPKFIPAPLMSSGLLLAFLLAYRDRQGLDLLGLKFALGGRIVGIAIAAQVLLVASQAVFDLLFSVLVLVAVILSSLGLSVAPTRRWAMLAGATSGFMGMISSIGGPPMALLYQRASGQQIRATLSGYFSVGGTLSLIVLASIGRFGWTELQMASLLLPGIALGGLVTGPLVAARLDKGSVRPVVLGLSTAAAVVVLIRTLA